MSEYIEKMREYMNLRDEINKSYNNIHHLKNELSRNSSVIFTERLQPTKKVSKRKTTKFITPNDWGNKDTCAVTIYKHGAEDSLSGLICNTGNSGDVKTFYCPHFDENVPCSQDCQYCDENNAYFELVNKSIPEAEIQYEELLAKRHIAWNQIFHKTK